MPYWKLDDRQNNAPTFPISVDGEVLTFSMMFVNDTAAPFLHSYLFVDDEFIDMLSAKRDFEDEYYSLRGVMDPEAFVGELPIGETQIDFRINLPASVGVFVYSTIPVYVAHDDGVILPSYSYKDSYVPSLWADCYEQSPLWEPDYKFVPGDCPRQVDFAEALFLDNWDDGFVDNWDDGFVDII